MATSRGTSFGRPALAWYRRHQRPLPWRQTRDPYAIWISEIMLQQTQVATVVPYYERFLRQLPDATTLAAADEDDVLRLWAGLGYYRRARQMHAAARQIVLKHAGQFPSELDQVLSLPGIGRYTAHAILSFAHDQRLGIVEANTQRLYARLMHWTEPLQTTASQHALWEFAGAIVPPRNCGIFNQAMMEIGSQICTPRDPDCDRCPLLAHCPTGQRGDAPRIPAPKPAKKITDLTEAVVLIRNTSAQLLVRRCGERERWAGLWDFPRFDISQAATPNAVASVLRTQMKQRFGIDCDVIDSGHAMRHAVTRYRIQLLCFFARPVRSRIRVIDAPNGAESRWLDLDQMHELAWNASGKRILTWLESHPTGSFDWPTRSKKTREPG